MSETTKEITQATQDEQLKLCRDAVRHLLQAIHDDPRKYWLLGEGTGSWDKLTTAASACWGEPVESVRENFQPRKREWDRYVAEKEEEKKLIDFCRDNLITATSIVTVH